MPTSPPSRRFWRAFAQSDAQHCWDDRTAKRVYSNTGSIFAAKHHTVELPPFERREFRLEFLEGFRRLFGNRLSCVPRHVHPIGNVQNGNPVVWGTVRKIRGIKDATRWGAKSDGRDENAIRGQNRGVQRHTRPGRTAGPGLPAWSVRCPRWPPPREDRRFLVRRRVEARCRDQGASDEEAAQVTVTPA